MIILILGGLKTFGSVFFRYVAYISFLRNDNEFCSVWCLNLKKCDTEVSLYELCADRLFRFPGLKIIFYVN